MVFSLFSWHTSGFKWCVTYRLGHFFHTDDRNVEFFPPFCFSSASPACVWRSILLAQNFSSSNTTVLGKAPQSYLFFGLYILLATLTVNKGRTLVNVESQLQQRPLTIAVAFFFQSCTEAIQAHWQKKTEVTQREWGTQSSQVRVGRKGREGKKWKDYSCNAVSAAVSQCLQKNKTRLQGQVLSQPSLRLTSIHILRNEIQCNEVLEQYSLFFAFHGLIINKSTLYILAKKKIV